MTRRLAPGVWVQVYRDAIPGGTHDVRMDKLKRACDEGRQLGIAGIIPHGFTGEFTPDKFAEYLHVAQARNLACGAAFGLNSDNPVGKGRRMASVANVAGCACVLADAEGALEDEATDKRAAADMMRELRILSPDALLIDQPWPIPTVHWSLFPWEEFGAAVDARAPQLYWNDWKSQWGKLRYGKVLAWHLSSWAKLEERLARTPGTSKPKIYTIQAYGHDDIPASLVRHLLDNRDAATIVWADWWLTDTFKRCMRAVSKLGHEGYITPGSDSYAIVREFQLAANAHGAGLDVDGKCGPATLTVLGV